MPASQDEPSQAGQMAPSGSQQPFPGQRVSKWRPGGTWGQPGQPLSLVGEESLVDSTPWSRCPHWGHLPVLTCPLGQRPAGSAGVCCRCHLGKGDGLLGLRMMISSGSAASGLESHSF